MKRATNAVIFDAFKRHWTLIEGRDSLHNGVHTGRASWGHSSFPTLEYNHETGVLYSFGDPLARWLDRKTILFNVDRPRSNDGGHSWQVRNVWRRPYWLGAHWSNAVLIPADVTFVSVSHGLLQKHGIDMAVADIQVIASTEDTSEIVYENREDLPTFEADMRRKYNGLGSYSHSSSSQRYHVAGGSLVMANDKLLWTGIDITYFCCEIDQAELKAVELANPGLDPIQAVQLALMPAPIRGGLRVERQGEFFFVPVTLTEEPKDIHKWVRLSDGRAQGWPVNMGQESWGQRTADRHTAHHTAREAVYWGEGKAEGTVNPAAYRRFVGLAKGDVRDFQHRKLVFQSEGWHEVWHNTQIASFSADGNLIRID